VAVVVAVVLQQPVLVELAVVAMGHEPQRVPMEAPILALAVVEQILT